MSEPRAKNESATDPRPLTEEERQALRQRAENAWEGPWYVERGGIMDRYRSRIIVVTGESEQDDADAAFIAHAREDVTRLLDLLEQAEASVEQLETDIGDHIAELEEKNAVLAERLEQSEARAATAFREGWTAAMDAEDEAEFGPRVDSGTEEP